MEGLDGKGPCPKSMKKESQITKKGFAQKFKVPKWVYQSHLAHFEAAPYLFAISLPLFAMFGRASDRPHITKMMVFVAGGRLLL